MKVDGTIATILQQKPNPTVTIAPDATVYQAIELMAEKNIGALPATEGTRLEGLMSERDYARKIILKGKSSKETKVREIMEVEPPSVPPTETVVACMKLMTDHRVRHLPVLEGDNLVGIVSIGDLVNWMISAQQAAIKQLEDYITGQYPV